MKRNICVCLEFLTEAHRALIEETARRCGFSVRFFTPEQTEEAKAFLPECEVLYAHSIDLVRAAPAGLKWYCCSWAGVERYCREEGVFANPDCLLTNSAGAYGVTIAEHLIMVILMLLRRMPEYQQVVLDRSWSNQLPVRSIRDSDITVLGTGNLGSTFAERARAMGAARIIGLSRSGKARESIYDELHPISRLDEILPRTHILVMTMPSTPDTVNTLTRERIALLPADAIVVNVGRGNALDQEALMEALNGGLLAGAALDVMVPEPLPKDHPLWNTKNLIITPHVAGNMTLGYTCDSNVRMFCGDLEAYASGRPMQHLVDRKRGY